MPEIDLLTDETIEDVLETTLGVLEYTREELEEAEAISDAYRMVMHDLIRSSSI